MQCGYGVWYPGLTKLDYLAGKFTYCQCTTYFVTFGIGECRFSMNNCTMVSQGSSDKPSISLSLGFIMNCSGCLPCKRWGWCTPEKCYMWCFLECIIHISFHSAYIKGKAMWSLQFIQLQHTLLFLWKPHCFLQFLNTKHGGGGRKEK